MLENTISINSEEALETEFEENAAEKADLQQTEDDEAEFEDADLSCEEEHSSEENTKLEDEEMLTLNVYGDTVKVSRGEAISAAQRGLAFDRMKAKLNLAKNDTRLKALDQLSEMCGKSVPQMLGDMAGQALADSLVERYGSTDSVPFEEIEALMQQLHSTRAQFENAADVWTVNDKVNQLEEFLHYNPGCMDIPQEVIAQAKEGKNLSLAFSQYQVQQLEQQLEETQKELNILKSKNAAKAKSMPNASSVQASASAGSIYGLMKSLW